jgi:uncharacterized protein YggE
MKPMTAERISRHIVDRALITLVIFWSVCPSLVAQDPPRPGSIPFVRATGDATIESKPDLAIVNIGVTTQAPTAAAAASQNAAQTTAVLDKIKSEIGTKGEIRTTAYSVNPNYTYPPNNTAPKITGYTASNTVQVKLDDISLVGRVLDGATASGANNVNGIQFSVKDEQGVRAQALRQAAQNAKSAAEAMAAALGLRVVRVHSAETGQASIVRPMQEGAMMRMAAAPVAPTPVEAGNVEVHATVTVTLEVAP